MTNTESSPITSDEHGTLVFTGVGIDLLRAATVASGLALKINTGIDMTRPIPGRSPLQVANTISEQLDWDAITSATKIKAPANWAGKRTNAGALLDLVLFMAVVYGWTPSGSVPQALGEKKLVPVLRKAEKIRAALLVIVAAEKAASGS